jgi:hypothetical protein
MFAVCRSDPAAALEAEEELTKARDMRANFTTGSNVNDMDVRFPGTESQLRRASITALKVDHGRELAHRGVEENQGQTSGDSCHSRCE